MENTNTIDSLPSEGISAGAQSYLDQLDQEDGFAPEVVPHELAATDEEVPAPPAKNEPEPTPTSEEPPPSAEQADAEADWRDDEVKALATSMGLSEEQLARMPSREAFEAAGIFFDQQLAAQGRAAMQAQQPPAPPNNGTAQPPTPPAAQTPAPVPAAVPQDLQSVLDSISKLGAEYGDEVAAPMKGLVTYAQAQSARLAAMESQQQQLLEFANWQAQQLQQHQTQQEIGFFHDQLSAIDPELFGKDWESATPVQRANREKVAPEVGALRTAEGQRSGGFVPLAGNKPLVTRAYRLAFGDTLIARAKQQKSQDIAAQSRQRLGGAARRHKPNPASPVAKDLTDDDTLLTEVRDLLDRDKGN